MGSYGYASRLGMLASSALRVWRAGNPIARYQMALFALGLTLRPVDWILSRLAEFPRELRIAPVVFISSYSRSGSTLVYQAMSRFCDCEYLNNLVSLFPRSYPLVSAAYRKVASGRSTTFENYYGRTLHLHGVSDSPELFGPWLRLEEAAEGRALPKEALDQIAGFFLELTSRHGKAVLAKNCNAYLRFGDILNMMPQAKCVFVKRNPADVVASTVRGRKLVAGASDKMWEFSTERFLAGPEANPEPVEEICRNLRRAFDMVESLALSNPARMSVISYEEFCQAPAQHVVSLANKLLGQRVDATRLEQEMPPFRPTTSARPGDPFGKKLSLMMDEYFPEWNNPYKV